MKIIITVVLCLFIVGALIYFSDQKAQEIEMMMER